VVDQTGVGTAVVEELTGAKLCGGMVPVTVTAGHRASRDDRGAWLVPKLDLVGVLQIVLQSKRIQFAASLADAAVLVEEMNFRIKSVTPSEAALESLREGQNDDLVIAIAVALWLAARQRPAEAPCVWRSSKAA